MFRFGSLALASIAALGFTVASPNVSRADSFGLSLNLGRTHIEFSNGHRHGPHAHYHGGYHGAHRHGPVVVDYHRHYPPRPVVVVPEYRYSPAPHYHNHGAIVVPHRGHYHVRPY